MFDYPDNDNQKGGNGQSNTDREIGIFAGVLIGGIVLLIALGLFLPALIVSFLVGGLAVAFKKMKWLPLVSGISLIVFVLLLMKFKVTALFQFSGIYKNMFPAKLMQIVENVFNHGKSFEITWQSYVLEIVLGIAVAFIVALVINKLQVNYFVKTKEDSQGKFLKSSQFQKIFNKRESITNKQQEKWRKSEKKTDIYFGIDIKGNAVELPLKQLFTHELIQGTTGSGKTVAMLAQAEACMKVGLPVIYVEAKGDPQIEHDLGKLAKKYGRKFKVFSDNTETTYNPIKNGAPSGVEERLMSVFDWSEPFYKNVSDNMLLKVIKFMDAYQIKRDLPTLLEYLNFDNIWKTLKSDSTKREITVKQKVKPKGGKTGDTGLVGAEKKEEVKYVDKKVVVYDLSEKAREYTKLFFEKENFDDEDFKKLSKIF